MSYDVELCDTTGDVLPWHGRPFEEGGTHAVGGPCGCELNITYNYAKVFDGLVRNLNGRTARVTRTELQAFVDKWPHARPSKDYWAPTPGNAVVAIRRLLTFADAYPDGIWSVS